MLKLDHVVYFTEKTPMEVVEEQHRLGWHAVIGGKHENWGTQNALMYIQNAYIEWLSVEHDEIAKNSNHQLVDLLLRDLPQGEGWGTVCFSVQGIERFNDKVVAAGYQTSGVLDAERKTATGSIRKWKMLFIEQAPSDDLPLPFFIEWEKEDDTRFEELRKEGTILPDNEKLAAVECLLSVDDPVKVVAEWSTLLSAKIGKENTITLPNILLKFIKKEYQDSRERLTEVVIEHL